MVPGGIKATRGTAGAVQRGFDAAVGAVEASPWSGVPQQTAAAQQRINQPGTIDRVLGPPDTMTQSGVDRTAKGVATGKAGQQINQFWNDFGELTRNLTTQEIIEGDFYKAGKSAPAMRDAWSRMSPEMKASVTQGHKKLLAAVDASLDQDWVEKWNKTSKQGQGQKQLPPAKMQPTDAAMTAAEAKYPMPTRDVTARDIKGNKRLLDKIRGGFQTDIQFAEGFDPAAVEARAAADAEYRQSTRSPKGSLTPTAEEVFEMQMGAESSRRAEKAKGHSKSHAAKNNMTIAQSKAVMNQTLTKLNNFGRIPTNVNPSTVPAITGAAFAIGISVAELINTYGNDEGGSWTWRDPRNAVLTTEGWGIPNKETGQGYAWGAVGETAVTAAGLSQATPDMFDEVGSGAFWTGMPRGIGQSGKEMYEHITGSVGGAGRKIANWMVDDPSLAAPDDEYMRRLKQERLDRILNQVPG